MLQGSKFPGLITYCASALHLPCIPLCSTSYFNLANPKLPLVRTSQLTMTSLNDNSLVFCTAEVPADLLTKFFQEAYSPNELVDELGAENVDIGIFATISKCQKWRR